MAGPITWQNVAAPNFSDAFRGMATAQQGFDTAFTGLGDLIKKREATEAANYDQGKINNTNALLGAIQEAKTPEEFAAREAALRTQLAGYGSQVDAAAARSALDSRLGTLQQRAVANQQFTDQQVDVAGRPIAAGYNSAIAQATTGNIRGLMESIQTATGAGAVDPRLATMLTEKALARSAALTAEGRAAADQQMQEELHPGALALQRASIRNQNEAAATSRAARSEKETSSGLNKLLLQHNQGYGADIAKWNSNVKAVGQEMKLPVDKTTGMPDLTALNPETLQAFKARIGEPPSSSERLAVFKKQMSDANVPLDQQVKAEALFEKTFGTGRDISATDQKIIEGKGKQIDERIAAKKKGSMLYSGNEEERLSEIQAAQTFFDGQMKDTMFVGSHRKAIDDILFNGLKVGDTTYPIPPKLMKLALSTAMDKDSYLFNTTEGQVKSFLTDYIASPAYAKEISTLAELSSDPNGDVAKKKLLDSFVRPTMETAPISYLGNINAALDAANTRAQAAAVEAQKKSR